MSSSHTHCHAHMVVGHIYKSVVNDTIAAVRSYFLDEGVDEQVLQELKQLWENKLSQSRAVPKDTDGQQTTTPSKPRSSHKQAHSSTGGGMAAQPAAPAPVAPTQSLVPIQITIPPQGQGGESKTIVVQVPVSAVQSGLAGQHLQTILSSPAAQATFALPPDVASNVLQRQLNEALRQPGAVGGQLDGCDDTDGSSHRRQTQGHSSVAREDAADAQTSEGAAGGVTPLRVSDCDVKYLVGATSEAGCSSAEHGTCSSSSSSPAGRRRRAADARLMRRLGPRLVVQLDGVGDSSDSDDDDDVDDVDDDVDDGDDSVLDDDDEEEQGQEEEPLNTEDDVSDHEPADLRETFNVMVCQYDKITRSRNKWKFYLKDGIMNLDGKDYIFQKANGDAEW